MSREGSPNVGVKLLVERPSDMKDCIRMAKGLYLRYFVLEPQQLLRSFPVNAVDSRGGIMFVFRKLVCFRCSLSGHLVSRIKTSP